MSLIYICSSRKINLDGDRMKKMTGKEREGVQGHSEQSKGGVNKRENF